jgi:DNA (cytosine-5)-methyltransferase 1
VKYLSLCSGIEAATQAWHPLGWRPVAFSEIDPFPCAVLAHHYPDVPNWGDMTRFQEWPDADVDVLVGGTPCQSFSVAGLRKGLADPRGNLMLTYLAIADRYRPCWIVWENVPGVLSSGGGRDFGAFLGGLGELGYGFAYRVLDAQYVRTCGKPFAVPQRRRRVFVVGYLGDWRRAAAVLVDREGLRGDSPPRRKAGQIAAPTLSARPAGGGGLGTDFDCDGGLIPYGPDVTPALKARDSKGPSSDGDGDGAPLLAVAVAVAPTLRAGGNSTGGDRHYGMDVDTCDSLVAVAIQERAVSENPDAGPQGAGFSADGCSYTLEARNKVQAVAYRTAGDGAVYEEGDLTAPLTTGTDQNAQIIGQAWAVRRLTPVECERLQGFPDGYTDVPYRRRNWTPDGPRYKALGNSMAVNCMEWIGERIAEVEAI